MAGRRLKRSTRTTVTPTEDDSSGEVEAVEDDSSGEVEAVEKEKPAQKKRKSKKAAKKDEAPAPARRRSRKSKKSDDDEPGAELAPAQSAEVAALFGGVAGELGDFEDDERLGTSESFPYLAFYNDRMNRSGEVEDELGELDDGHPCLHAGDGEWYDADGLEVLILAHFPYWCTLDDGTYQPDEIRLTPQPFDPDPTGFRKNILTITMVLSGAKVDLDDELLPAIATLTTYRSTKAGIVEKHVSAVRKTTQSGWAKNGGAMEKAVVAWPKNYRIASGIVIKTKSSKSKKGRTYTIGEARPHTLTLDQAKLAKEFLTDPECMAELDEIKRAFDAQIAELKGRDSSD
jgi:hypothetical protein